MAVKYTKFNKFWIFFSYDCPENYYSGIFKITEDDCKFRFCDDESNMAAIYTFSSENHEIVVW